MGERLRTSDEGMNKADFSDKEARNLLEKIRQIEQYLGSDYSTYLQLSQQFIDYSFVSEEKMRNRFVDDNREMIFWRYGLSNHKSSFEEFCRYAHMQVEGLLNYFYHKKNDGDITAIVDHIKRYNPMFDPKQTKNSIKYVESINHSLKLFAFKKEFQEHLKGNNEFVFDNVNKVRNELLHRGIEIKSKQELYEELKEYKENELKSIPTKGWEIDKDKATQEQIAKIKGYGEYEQKVKKYKQKEWEENKPFDDIQNGLVYMVECVKNNI